MRALARFAIIAIAACIILMFGIPGKAAFCCNDSETGEAKCWAVGTCCNGIWYIGCEYNGQRYCPDTSPEGTCMECKCDSPDNCYWVYKDELCTGNCDYCGSDGKCHPNHDACVGNCDYCEYVSDTHYDCAKDPNVDCGNCGECDMITENNWSCVPKDPSPCTGTCAVCYKFSETNYSCAGDNNACVGNCDYCKQISEYEFQCEGDVALCPGSNQPDSCVVCSKFADDNWSCTAGTCYGDGCAVCEDLGGGDYRCVPYNERCSEPWEFCYGEGTTWNCVDFRPYMKGCRYYDWCKDGHEPGDPDVACEPPSLTSRHCTNCNETLCHNEEYIKHGWFTCVDCSEVEGHQYTCNDMAICMSFNITAPCCCDVDCTEYSPSSCV